MLIHADCYRYYYNSCTTTWLELNTDYVFTLYDMLDNNKYEVFEANIATSGASELDDVDLAEMVKICGFDDVEAITDTAGVCQMPSSETTSDNCLEPEPESDASTIAHPTLLIMAMAVLSLMM